MRHTKYIFFLYLFSSRRKKRYIQSNQNHGIEGKQKKMRNEDHLFAVEMTMEWAMHAAQFFNPFLLFYIELCVASNT